MTGEDSLVSVPEHRFDSSPLSRRQFVRLSAATAGAVAVPGAVSAETTSETFTPLYEFVLNHTDADFAVASLILLEDAAGFADLEDLGLDPETTTEPRPAAWARLTEDEAAAVADVESVTELQYSPGSNPFWRLGQYERGVFPDVYESVDFVDYEQLIDGMRRLESAHSDRLRFRAVGESPGYDNLFLDERDPKEVYVAEVTNDVTDEDSFREKEKVLFVQSIHGDERSGVEAGSRLVERLLAGGEPELESLLDDVVLLFLYANPDGWVARRPEYGDEPSFTRTTGAGNDPNRQYPTVGWIDSGRYPAEPDGANLRDDDPGVDDDVPEEYVTNVPDSLAIVEHMRSYENLEYGTDLHGMYWSEELIFGLIVNDQYDHGEYHDLYHLNRTTKTRLESALGPLLEEPERQAFFEDLNERIGDEGGFDGSVLPTPEGAFDYGTILDTIGYTTSGTLISWMSQPPEKGGLGITMMAHEIGWDNAILDRIPYMPELVELHVVGYQEVIRATAAHTARDVEATIETDGASTAYVETDALTRTSADLELVDADRVVDSASVSLDARPRDVRLDVSSSAVELSVSVDPDHGEFVRVRLIDPTGRTVHQYNPLAGSGPQPRPGVEWTIEDPERGEWTVELKTLRGGRDASVTVRSAVLLTERGDAVETVDPLEAIGYQQRAYEVTPLEYYDAYAEYVTGPGRSNGRTRGRHGGPQSIDGLSVEEIRDGGLFRGRSRRPAVDNVVVNHDDGIDDDAYVAELDRFVDAGGTLVATDRGVHLLGVMETATAGDLEPDDVAEFEAFSSFLGEKNPDHPLLAGTRPIQRELWKPAPLGYPIDVPGYAPTTGIDPDAFEDAGGSIAGIAYDDPFGADPVPWVAAGTLPADDGAIHVIGGLLPPGRQRNLHPFGLLEHTPTFLGHTMLTNALGYRQRRYVDGDLVDTVGD